MNLRKTLIPLCAAAAAAALGATAASADPPSGGATLRHAPVVARSVADVPSQTSSNWAGYAITSSSSSTTPTTFTSVSGSWIQPAATCSTASGQTYSAFWIGLGGFADGSQALEQTGTEADCTVRGKPTYSVWYELVPAAPVTVNLKIQPGDAISATVGVSGQTVTIQIANTTRGTSFTKQLPMSNPDVTSAEWIAEAPSSCGNFGGCRPLPLTNFGTVTFTSSSATSSDGHVGTISDPAWTATSVALQGTSATRFRGRFGSPLPVANATPGALSSDGSSFPVSWSQQTPTTGGGTGGYPYPQPGWGYGRGWH